MNFTHPTKDGYELYAQYSPVENAKGTIVFSHGFVEYTAHYSRIAKLFNEHGFNLLKYDLRGHGRSTAPASSVTSYTILSDDLGDIVQWAKDQEPSLPIFVMGFSLGGLVTTLYTLFHPYETHGQILLGPGLKGSKAFLDFPQDEISILEFLNIMGTAGDEGIRQLVQMESPHVLKSIPKVFAQQVFHNAQETVLDQASSIRLSTLIIHGRRDPMINIENSERFFESISSIDKTLKIIEEGEHDLLRTRHSERVIAYIAQWCEERL